MNDFNQVKLAQLALRITLGVMYLTHSVVLKGITYTLAGTAQYFVSIGLPGPLAYVVFTAEAIGGVLLIAGYQVRLVSLALVPILAGALWAHAGNGWVFSNEGGGWEYPLFLIATSVVLALMPERARAPASVPGGAAAAAVR